MNKSLSSKQKKSNLRSISNFHTKKKGTSYILAAICFLLLMPITLFSLQKSQNLRGEAAGPLLMPTPIPIIYNTVQWETALGKAIHSDVGESVKLPNGDILWIFGDTIQVNGVATCCTYGYPHDAFVVQKADTLDFTPIPGKYGYGWQQIPNWTDGIVFWVTTPVVDNGVLYVLGSRVKTSGKNFSVLGTYMAEFDTRTLAYQNIKQIPSGSTGTTIWGGVWKGRDGFWLTGTHNVPCSFVTDCKVGDLAYIPFGAVDDNRRWRIYNNIIPASNNLGTTLAITYKDKNWDIFTKVGDGYNGSNDIERLSSSSLPGQWSITGSWPVDHPKGTLLYGAAVHPAEASPTGKILVTYDVNGMSQEPNETEIHFIYLPQ